VGDSDSKRAVVSLFEEVSHVYDAGDVDFFGQIGRHLVELARLEPGEFVLDVGCGSGAVLLHAAEAVGPGGHVLGIDLAGGMVGRARQAARLQGFRHVEVAVADAEAPPVAEQSLDAVLASLVLFFLPNIAAELDAYARALRRGGRLVFSTFAAGDPWEQLDEAVQRFAPGKDDAPGPQWFDTLDGIEALVRSSGFVDVAIDEVTHPVSYPSPEAWYDWTWTTGWRSIWKRMPDTARQQARAAAFGLLASHTRSDGTITLDTNLRYTFARLP